jgi:hypothetical protein
MANARWRALAIVGIVMASCVCSSAATVTATGTWAATGTIVPGISEFGASWSMSFEMETEPEPTSSDEFWFFTPFSDFSYILGGTLVAVPVSDISFYDSDSGGLFRVIFGDAGFIDLLGAQAFTGPASDPVMRMDVYEVTGGGAGLDPDSSVLTHNFETGGEATVTPEPSTFAIGGAALALVALLRRCGRA